MSTPMTATPDTLSEAAESPSYEGPTAFVPDCMPMDFPSSVETILAAIGDISEKLDAVIASTHHPLFEQAVEPPTVVDHFDPIDAYGYDKGSPSQGIINTLAVTTFLYTGAHEIDSLLHSGHHIPGEIIDPIEGGEFSICGTIGHDIPTYDATE